MGPLLNTCLLRTCPTYQDCHNGPTDFFNLVEKAIAHLDKFSGIGQLKGNFNEKPMIKTLLYPPKGAENFCIDRHQHGMAALWSGVLGGAGD